MALLASVKDYDDTAMFIKETKVFAAAKKVAIDVAEASASEATLLAVDKAEFRGLYAFWAAVKAFAVAAFAVCPLYTSVGAFMAINAAKD